MPRRALEGRESAQESLGKRKYPGDPSRGTFCPGEGLEGPLPGEGLDSQERGLTPAPGALSLPRRGVGTPLLEHFLFPLKYPVEGSWKESNPSPVPRRGVRVRESTLERGLSRAQERGRESPMRGDFPRTGITGKRKSPGRGSLPGEGFQPKVSWRLSLPRRGV